MFSKSLLWAGLLACLSLPAWAGESSTDLRQLIARVWDEHPAVQAALAGVEAARARLDAAGRPLYNPELAMDAERTDVDTLSLGISQTIDWGDKRGAYRAMGEADVVAARAELRAVRQRVAGEVLRALARLHTARGQLELARQRAELMQQLVATSRERYAAGDVGRLDLAVARVARSESRVQLARGESELASLASELRAASGLALDRWPTLPAEPPVPPVPAEMDAVLGRLPKLAVQQAHLDAARAAVSLSRAKRKADPTLGVRGGSENSELLLGLNFSVPLNVRNPYKAEVSAARQKAIQAEKTLLDMRRLAANNLEGSLKVYRLTHTAWRQWQTEGREGLAEQLQLVQRIWRGGELSTTEYLLQTRQNIDAQIAASELSGELWQTWVDWLLATGKVESWVSGGNASNEK